MPVLFLPVIDAPKKKAKQRRSGEPAPQTPRAECERHLLTADLIVINSSGGKDSQTALEEVVKTCDRLGIPRSKLLVVHADLGEVEWKGTLELAREQAQHYGIRFEVESYRSEKKERRTLLEHIILRGMWPDSVNRYCTSDFKRNPICRVFTRHAHAHYGRRVSKLPAGRTRFKVVNCLGMRAAESDARRLLPNWVANKANTNPIKEVWNWLPIFDLSTAEVWDRIKASGVRHHWAYDLGMPRLSCCFCIFSPRAALILAGKHNRDLLVKYVAAEKQMGHTFRQNISLAEVLAAVDAGEKVERVDDWEM